MTDQPALRPVDPLAGLARTPRSPTGWFPPRPPRRRSDPVGGHSLLVTSPRVAPGLMSRSAWYAVESASVRLCRDASEPVVDAVVESGLSVDAGGRASCRPRSWRGCSSTGPSRPTSSGSGPPTPTPGSTDAIASEVSRLETPARGRGGRRLVGRARLTAARRRRRHGPAALARRLPVGREADARVAGAVPHRGGRRGRRGDRVRGPAAPRRGARRRAAPGALPRAGGRGRRPTDATGSTSTTSPAASSPSSSAATPTSSPTATPPPPKRSRRRGRGSRPRRRRPRLATEAAAWACRPACRPGCRPGCDLLRPACRPALRCVVDPMDRSHAVAFDGASDVIEP